MREIVLDTETTGFDAEGEDRIVEIGAVEVVDFVPTGRTYQVYINPERDVPEEAFRVHKLSTEFLSDKPVFADVADGFLEFIGESPLVIHNAAFDMRFINAELSRSGRPQIPASRAIDTMEISKKRFPGGVATLDALCRRLGVDNSARVYHGALLDADLLASAYSELNGGRSPKFDLSHVVKDAADDVEEGPKTRSVARSRSVPLPSRLTPEEVSAHESILAEIGKKAKSVAWLASREPTPSDAPAP